MNRYQEVFSDYRLHIAQCLLTYTDVQTGSARENILNTFSVLWQNHFIPIINENDTVATEEIKFGDNDKLAALVAILVKADLLVIASDMDGLYNHDPKLVPDAKLITLVNDIETVGHYEGTSKSTQGTGGIQSKLIAATLCMEEQIEMWIVNGQQENFIIRALAGSIPFTRFLNK
jgi:glutamate 5-kinase